MPRIIKDVLVSASVLVGLLGLNALTVHWDHTSSQISEIIAQAEE